MERKARDGAAKLDPLVIYVGEVIFDYDLFFELKFGRDLWLRRLFFVCKLLLAARFLHLLFQNVYLFIELILRHHLLFLNMEVI